MCLYFTGPSSTVAVACDDGCLRLFRAEEGQPGLVYAASLPSLGSRLLTVAWNPKGNIVLTGTSEGSLHAWNVNSRREILRIHTGMLLGLSGTGSCRRAYTLLQFDKHGAHFGPQSAPNRRQCSAKLLFSSASRLTAGPLELHRR